MAVTEKDLEEVKKRTAILFAVLVECLKAVDDQAKGRVISKLDEASQIIRNEPDNSHVSDLLGRAQELVTGFSQTSGQGRTFFQSQR